MLAVDTNIVVRYLTRDHPQQARRAKQLIDDNDVFVATTVLLETEWVLRSAYGQSRAEIAEAVGAFIGLPHVTLEDSVLAAKALDWFASGMDFADAVHLAGTGDCEAFLTFDRRLVMVARRVGQTSVKA